MNYRQTLDFLYNQLPMFQRVGASAYKIDLTNTIAICNVLENPQTLFRSIHIAGTNGKGSVAHMIASILQESGYKTGLYTSPHLKDFRERIKINGNKIPVDDVISFVEKNSGKFDEIKPSFFEYTFGMASEYFAVQKVDIAVVETGMGGRLDSTNIIIPLLSVITNIGIDHTRYLGDTIEKIALEKAGVIKPGIPVVIGETQQITGEVFRRIAAEKKSKIIFADQEYVYGNVISFDTNNGGVAFDIKKSNQKLLKNIKLPFNPNYQIKNAVTAFATIGQLLNSGYKISEMDLRSGFRQVIKNTGISGRWQTLRKIPLTICDTAHNEDGIREVVAQIRKTNFNQLHFVLGVVNDKQLGDILGLLPKEALYYFCKADIPRGLDQEVLKMKAGDFGLFGKSYPTVKIAYKNALENAGSDDLIFIGGSTFVVAEVL